MNSYRQVWILKIPLPIVYPQKMNRLNPDTIDLSTEITRRPKI